MQVLQQREAVGDVRHGAEQGEEHGGQRDAERLPLAEDHDRQGQEAHAGHALLEVPLGDCGNDVGHAADAAEETGEHYAGVPHPVDVDADAVRGLRMLAAGAQAEAQPGLVQDEVGDQQQDDADRDEHAQLQSADLEQVGEVAEVQLRGVAAGNPLGDDHRDGGGQDVQRGTADRLVRFQVDGRKAEQQRVDQARPAGDQDGKDDIDGRGEGEELGCQHAGQAADDHDALQCDIDDTAAFGEHTAQCHQHQHHGIQESEFDQQQHQMIPPFCFRLKSLAIRFLNSIMKAHR